VPYHLVEPVVAACEIRDFPRDTLLLKRGDINNHVAFVIQGRLRVHLDAADSGEFIEFGAGEFAGEMSIIDGQPVSAYVHADAGTRVLLMDGKTFLAQALVIPEVARNVMAAFAGRMRANTALIARRMKAAMELQRLQRELRFARSVQAGMMPQRSPLFPERGDVDCAGHMVPAREVGGDFYDAFFVDADTLFLTLGDACDKGMPAALLMARTLTVLRSEASRHLPGRRLHICTIMKQVNGLLSANNESLMFSSVFAALFDVKSGALHYVNAGHNPPLFVPASGGCVFLSEPRNPVIGVKEQIDFQGGETTLPRGATLLIYSDGITEAATASGEQFGEHRLAASVGRWDRSGAPGLVNQLLSDVQAFAAGSEQSDDITLLALRYTG
jgi:serine phosphatase RsbU (regulator of sigma subunit)